jgi:hypothetical protein
VSVNYIYYELKSSIFIKVKDLFSTGRNKLTHK